MRAETTVGTWWVGREKKRRRIKDALASGWETALGLCWKSGVAAEVLCQPKWGTGSQLQAAKAYLDAPGLFAWTVVIILLSLGMEWLLSGQCSQTYAQKASQTEARQDPADACSHRPPKTGVGQQRPKPHHDDRDPGLLPGTL